MKRNFLCVLTVLGAFMTAAAENVNTTEDALQASHCSFAPKESSADEYTLKKPEVSKEIADILEKNSTDTLKYYRNFLGEKCIDFGNSKPYYNWKRDVTYAGIPIFLSSFIIKSQKKAFRSARFNFEENFKSEVDNYTQFAPYAVVTGLKLAGYEGRSDWPRFVTSTLLANAVMATFVNSTKYSVKEMRPDNSTRNSFPSGHTATAFAAATVLHKEYGLTRSPWFSVGGYTVATATGIMRVLNNRHWISDVVAGAGIGLFSTEVGYFLGDMIFKNRGIMRKEMAIYTDPNHPSFFDIQMGVGMHTGRIDFTFDNDDAKDYIRLGTSTVFGVEGAHFLNKYIGIGGMARITTTPSRGLNIGEDDQAVIAAINSMLGEYEYYDAEVGKNVPLPGIYSMYLDNNNFIDISLDCGVYGNLPLSHRLSLGGKLLVGTRMTSGVSYKARNGRPSVAGTYTLTDGSKGNLYWYEDAYGNRFISAPAFDAKINNNYNYVLENATEEYEMMKVDGNSSLNLVAGLSLTWRYKENFSWKVFADYDIAKNKYFYYGKAFSDEAIAAMEKTAFVTDYPEVYEGLTATTKGKAEKFMNLFTIGGAFTVNF